ncbi:MAG: hypothetical protein H0T92_21305 [Pyrinomonadaceae bacterium]|nr:hypothetical protein [Pyrinomonadaceae bacterium]
MKLRIRGNSLRLRLTRSEVARLAGGETVEEAIIFGIESNQRLIYALETSPDARHIEADYCGARITVRLPADAAREWANTDMISLNGKQSINANKPNSQSDVLKLLIEKDFSCLTESRGADDEDTFPHPMDGILRC